MVPAMPSEPGVRRILFSDRPRPDVSAFGVEVVLLQGDASNPVAARRLSRAPKIRPHLYLPPHDVSVWMDANIAFKRPGANWAACMLAELGVAVAAFAHPNPESQNVAGQARAVCHWGLDFADVVESQLGRMALAGFKDDLQLTENCFMVRRDGAATRELGEVWWLEYCLGSLRDQMSFQFALWRCNMACGIIPGHSRDNDVYRAVPHVGSHQIAPRGRLRPLSEPREGTPAGASTAVLRLREAASVCDDAAKMLSEMERHVRFRPEWLRHGGSNIIRRLRNIANEHN